MEIQHRLSNDDLKKFNCKFIHNGIEFRMNCIPYPRDVDPCDRAIITVSEINSKTMPLVNGTNVIQFPLIFNARLYTKNNEFCIIDELEHCPVRIRTINGTSSMLQQMQDELCEYIDKFLIYILDTQLRGNIDAPKDLIKACASIYEKVKDKMERPKR